MFTRHSEAVAEASRLLSSNPELFRGYSIEREVATVSGRPLAIGYRLTMLKRHPKKEQGHVENCGSLKAVL